MRTYLSIDLDYWKRDWFKHGKRELGSLLKRAIRRDIPIVAVMNHQQLLREVNISGARCLINIDEHSDLAEADVDELNCGTWVSYVRWRREGKYIWVRNSHGFGGSCNWSTRYRQSNAGWRAGTDWNQTETEYGGRELKLTPHLRNCVGIGLCMSPNWSTYLMQGYFYDMVDDFGIPYRKGRVDEESVRRRIRPPFRGQRT